MSIVKRLRDAAMTEVKPELRSALRRVADGIAVRMIELPTADNELTLLQEINGFVAHGYRLLNNLTPPAEPVPPADACEVEQRRAA